MEKSIISNPTEIPVLDYWLGNSRQFFIVFYNIAQQMKFSIKDLFSKCDQIRSKVTHT